MQMHVCKFCRRKYVQVILIRQFEQQATKFVLTGKSTYINVHIYVAAFSMKLHFYAPQKIGMIIITSSDIQTPNALHANVLLSCAL
jgi:hypothetical protein